MQTVVKPTASDDRRDFVVVPSDLVIPSDQVRVAPSDAEITDLLRAAARQHAEAGARAAPDADAMAPTPTVDTTFRATAVSDDLPVRGSSFGRKLMRGLAAVLVAAGITGAALGWQFFGYATKKAFGKWLPQLAVTSSLSLDRLEDKLGLGSESKPADKPADAQADAAPAQAAAPVQNAADNRTPESATAAPAVTAAAADSSPDTTAQQLQSMAHDLASANQEIEALKASIAELKSSQQQMARDLAKATEKLAEQSARAKVAATTPRPAHRQPSSYAPASSYSPSPAAAPSAYRPAPSSYSAQAAAAPPAAAQPYNPPPIPLQPEPGSASVPRPPMPVQ